MEVLAGFSKYETYKSSGVDWLEDIPETWSIMPAKRKHRVGKLINKGNKYKNVLSLTLRGVVNNDSDNPEGLVPRDYASYQLFEKDDLVFKLIDLENLKTSRVGIVHEQGIMSPAYIRLEINDQYFSKYAYYYFYSLYLNAVYNNLGQGVRSTLGPSDLLEIPIVEPRYEEQVAIASFLDNRLIQIDEAIAIKEKQIALLKERKQIIIQKAVTQGLVPNVPMKDSGVDWIGNIPEHWGVLKLKHLFKEVNDKTSTGVETLLSLRMELGLVPHDDVSDKPISDKELVGYKKVSPGQMVMNRMRAAIGIFGIPKVNGLVSPDYAVYDAIRELNLEFFLLLFKTPVLGTQFRLGSKGLGTGSSGFMRLYSENFGDIKIPYCSKDEQTEILNYINESSNAINGSIKLIERQIEKLKEYKTTLINSAVTGKIKVA